MGFFADIAGAVITAVTDREGLVLENLALRQQLAMYREKRPKPKPGPLDRAFWVALSRCWAGWASALIVVKPETVVRWHREGFRLYWRLLSWWRARPDVRRVPMDVREAIRKLARENPGWGAPRIHGEMLKLGFDVSERTVARYLPRRKPDPERRQRWRTFLGNHREAIFAMDLFTIPTATFRVLYGFVVIDHARRKILHFGVTEHPHTEWIVRQLRGVFPFLDVLPKYLIFDRDSIFGSRVREVVRQLGMKPKQIAYRSPWQNPVCERWIGSFRRDVLDHVVVLGEDHLRRMAREYLAYHHADRTHLGLAKDTPNGRAVERRPSRDAALVGEPRVGGLHHRYRWQKVA